MQQAHDKALRAPVLLLLVVEDRRGDADIDLLERTISAGAALQNMMLMATALGFGSALTSGKALKSAALRRLFGLGAQEHAVCFLNVGSVQQARPRRLRPDAAQYLRVLAPAPPPG